MSTSKRKTLSPLERTASLMIATMPTGPCRIRTRDIALRRTAKEAECFGQRRRHIIDRARRRFSNAEFHAPRRNRHADKILTLFCVINIRKVQHLGFAISIDREVDIFCLDGNDHIHGLKNRTSRVHR